MNVEEINRNIYEYKIYDFPLNELIEMFKMQVKISNENFVQTVSKKMKRYSKDSTNHAFSETEMTEILIKKSLHQIEDLKNVLTKYLSVPDNVLLREDQIRNISLVDGIQDLRDTICSIEMEITRNKAIVKLSKNKTKEMEEITAQIDYLDSLDCDFSNMDISVISSLASEINNLKKQL